MLNGRTLLAIALCAMGCGEPAGVSVQDVQREVPRWATHFHWEESGRVLVLDGGVRVVRDAPKEGEQSVGDDAQLATWSTTHVALLEAFGGLEHWAGGTSLEYLQSSAARDHVAAGKAVDYGADAGAAMEQLHRHPPSAVTVFPFYDPFEGMVMPAELPVLPITEYSEPHPLGRAEWMRAFGWLVGMEAEADAAFEAVESRYEALRTGARQQSWRVFTGSLEGDAFWAPSGSSFIAQLLADAGVDYAFADDRREGSIPVDFEQLLRLNGEVDTWGVVWHDADSLTWAEVAAAHPIYAELRPNHGAIFAANTRTCDYFGQLVAAPDLLLRDLVDLFHGSGTEAGCFEWIEVP